MDFLFRDALYWPRLRGKLGERMLYFRHDQRRLNYTVPTVILTKPGEYDRESDKKLTPLEFVNSFGARAKKAFGIRPFFLDAKSLGDIAPTSAGAKHPLIALFGRAKMYGARPMPIVDLGSSDNYIDAARVCAHANIDLPCGIRLSGSDIEDVELREKLEMLLDEMDVEAERCVLFVDFANDLSGEASDIAPGVAEWINGLPFLQEWLQLVLQAGSFPIRDGLQAGQFSEYPRLDLPLYLAVVRSEGLLRKPMFGGYGVEPAVPPVSSGGRAVAKLHYSSADRYGVEKGKSTIVGQRYENIRPVAKQLSQRKIFSGSGFSFGDARIVEIGSGKGAPGNPAVWRYIGLDHHFTVTLDTLSAELRRKKLPEFTSYSTTKQDLLI